MNSPFKCDVDGFLAFDLPQLFERGTEDAIPPHDSSTDEEDERDQAQHGPERFDWPSTEAAEVKAREPAQYFITDAHFTIGKVVGRFEAINERLKRIRKREIYAGYRPY